LCHSFWSLVLLIGKTRFGCWGRGQGLQGDIVDPIKFHAIPIFADIHPWKSALDTFGLGHVPVMYRGVPMPLWEDIALHSFGVSQGWLTSKNPHTTTLRQKKQRVEKDSFYEHILKQIFPASVTEGCTLEDIFENRTEQSGLGSVRGHVQANFRMLHGQLLSAEHSGASPLRLWLCFLSWDDKLNLAAVSKDTMTPTEQSHVKRFRHVERCIDLRFAWLRSMISRADVCAVLSAAHRVHHAVSGREDVALPLGLSECAVFADAVLSVAAPLSNGIGQEKVRLRLTRVHCKGTELNFWRHQRRLLNLGWGVQEYDSGC